MNEAKLSFYDMFDERRATGVPWATLKPSEISEEKHLWLYNRRDRSPGGLATRLRLTAIGLTPAGQTICSSKLIEARSDGIAGNPEPPFADDAQADFTPLGGSLLDDGKYLNIGDIPPGGGRRLIFRLNLPEGFDDYGPALILLTVGYREPEVQPF
jgi:hypothetical protein